MIVLITATLLGLGFAILATQNTTGVTLQAGPYRLTDIPVYLVVLVSLMTGLLLAWLLSAVGWVSTTLTMRGKNAHIRHTEKEADQLRAKVQKLEAENSSLRDQREAAPDHTDQENDYTPQSKRSLLDRLRLRSTGSY